MLGSDSDHLSVMVLQSFSATRLIKRTLGRIKRYIRKHGVRKINGSRVDV